MFTKWETALDQSILDTVDHYDCGEDIDINPGLSEITDPTQPILGYDVRGNVVEKDILSTPFNPYGLCKIYGSIVLPWGYPYKIARIEMYDDTMMNSQSIFTNRAGSYFFLGVPKQRITLYFPNGKKYWVAVPDKKSCSFEDVMIAWGFEL